MELRHLRTFLAVAETLNISEAARRLHVTQPALGRQIRELEHTMGTALFVREAGKLRLTPAGITLRDHGAPALASVETALRRARDGVVEPNQTLRVGYYGTVTIWAALIAPALRRLREEFPEVTTTLFENTSAQLAADMRAGRLDVSVLGPGDAAQTPGIVATLAGEVPALVMLPATHHLAGKTKLSLDDLRNEEIISFAPHLVPGRDRALIARCEAAGFTPKISPIAAALPELIDAVIARNGLALVTPFAKNAPHPFVIFTQLEAPGVPLEIYAAYALQASTAARRLAELIVDETRRVLVEL